MKSKDIYGVENRMRKRMLPLFLKAFKYPRKYINKLNLFIFRICIKNKMKKSKIIHIYKKKEEEITCNNYINKDELKLINNSLFQHWYLALCKLSS